DPDKVITIPPAEHLEAAKKSAIQSFVLLKNDNDLLPLDKNIPRVAVIGPMADDRYEQLGTWVFDGDTSLSVTPLMAFQDFLGKERINYAKGVQTTRSMGQEGFSKAIAAARQSDAVIVFAGEESILTGEAHSRAYLDLPGAQNDLIKEIARTSKPVVLVV
ncbi:glycoside hydrolase family 3 C-terminal domain-containing protein, partial [Arthrospira platensis SPKY1]|nr:glycoside hydrolase family 3 C-terminal domain-containing protein [Arthrospira platensis SPKY1]